MLADDGTVMADDDALGVGLHLHRPADGPRSDRVFVVVKAHQAGSMPRPASSGTRRTGWRPARVAGARPRTPARSSDPPTPGAGLPWRRRYNGRAARRSVRCRL